MMQKDILKGEFIGKTISVCASGNKSLVGMKGEIVDETKNCFVLSTPSGRKTILKSQITFITQIDGKDIKIEGKKLCFRPEERVKKIR